MKARGGNQPLKVGLITGCHLRRCRECGDGVIVPEQSDWERCIRCKQGYRHLFPSGDNFFNARSRSRAKPKPPPKPLVAVDDRPGVPGFTALQ